MMLKKSFEVFIPENSGVVLGGEGQLLNGVPDKKYYKKTIIEVKRNQQNIVE